MNSDVLIEAFRRMTRIRLAEQIIAEDFCTNKVFSFLHLYVGQEAVATGVCLAIDKEDRVFGNHRSHGHYIAKGGDLYRMFCEIYGRVSGCCKGKGGSMHMLDRRVGFMGSTPILGSVAPIASGSAFEQKARGSDKITVAFFGDGASEEGVVYESINMAAVMKLPVIFVIENNLYSVSSDASVRRSEKFSAGKVYGGLGAGFFSTNGNSFVTMYQATRSARKWIEDGLGPAVIEARVFRHMAHSGPIYDDAAGYRKIDTKHVREEACPLKDIIAHIRGNGMTDEGIDRIHEEVRQGVQEAFDRAKQVPAPEPAELWSGVYA